LQPSYYPCLENRNEVQPLDLKGFEGLAAHACTSEGVMGANDK